MIRRSPISLAALAVALCAALPHPASAQGYGSTSGWGIVLDVEDASGLVLGVRHYLVSYGQRRVSWKTRVQTRVLASVRGGLGTDVVIQRQLSPGGVVLSTEAGVARRLRSYRFHGFGNGVRQVDAERALVPLDEVWLGANLEVPVGDGGALSVGPAFLHVRPDPHEAGPLARNGGPGSRPFSQLGAIARLELSRIDDALFPRKGVALLTGVSAWAPVLDAIDAFGGGDIELRAYVPVVWGGVLAARARAAVAVGPFPTHEAVFLGGSESLRGHRRQRFAGDGAASGSLELRMPVLHIPVTSDGRLGALAFTDAGRVFFEGDSPGGWHDAWGAGAWYGSTALTVTAVMAWGEQRSTHLYLGLPF